MTHDLNNWALGSALIECDILKRAFARAEAVLKNDQDLCNGNITGKLGKSRL